MFIMGNWELSPINFSIHRTFLFFISFLLLLENAIQFSFKWIIGDGFKCINVLSLCISVCHNEKVILYCNFIPCNNKKRTKKDTWTRCGCKFIIVRITTKYITCTNQQLGFITNMQGSELMDYSSLIMLVDYVSQLMMQI